ncbi:MAG TPA: hypothetical protein VIQ76_20825 [Propionibacteriaceae bacterium]
MTEPKSREERFPVMDGATDATPEEKIRGLLDQLAADVHRYPNINAEAVVRQWLKDAAVEPSDSEVRMLVAGFQKRGLRLESDQ